MTNMEDLKVLDKLSRMGKDEMTAKGNELVASCSLESRQVARTVVELRLGQELTTSDDAVVRMARAVVDHGKSR